MARHEEGAAAGTVRPPITTKPTVAATITSAGWRVQCLADRYSITPEIAAVIVPLALGGAHG